ncbi:hypothetical protein LCGC14_1211660 [marine sediment metagenome]|uniref:Uncharacterized protein n=1 Tax=marine sediment metagenome TaxID=412755 RepID=A0A0F9NW67_9ZZZZ
MNEKKLIAFGIMSVLAIMFVTAGLVSHFVMVQADIEVQAPITLEGSLFTFNGTEILNDGENHYLLVKGWNSLGVEIPAIPVITITRDGQEITDTTGIHLAIDGGGDMHYCYDLAGDMTNVDDCDVDYVQWLTNNNNEDWFDWVGTDTYENSGFVSPIVNHGGNSWYTIEQAGGTYVNGVITLPETGVDPGLFAALLVVKADFGVTPGNYKIKVEFNPVA